MDVRDVEVRHLEGFDAVLHLAAVSNDPVGDLNPDCTYDINYRATVRLAEVAKEAAVPRFLFSSSCSLYGAAGDAVLDETAAFQRGDAVRGVEDTRRARAGRAGRRRPSVPPLFATQRRTAYRPGCAATSS